MRSKYQSNPSLKPIKHEDMIALIERYGHDVFNPQALATTGLGYEDIAHICDISREDAKRIVWAAHDTGGQRDPRRIRSDGLGHEGEGRASQGRDAPLVAPVPAK